MSFCSTAVSEPNVPLAGARALFQDAQLPHHSSFLTKNSSRPFSRKGFALFVPSIFLVMHLNAVVWRDKRNASGNKTRENGQTGQSLISSHLIYSFALSLPCLVRLSPSHSFALSSYMTQKEIVRRDKRHASENKTRANGQTGQCL
jgi:hypothetical protein